MRRFKRLSVPDHAHPLVRRLFTEMNQQQIGILDMAERAGVNKNTLGDWKNRAVPNIANIDACYNVLGLRLGIEKAGR